MTNATQPATPLEKPSQGYLDFYDRQTRAPRLRALFDSYAPDFDRSMGQLGYAAPRLLAELVEREAAGRTSLRVLDLGCGTGLAGLAIRDRAARLDGVDLSPAMVERARARGIYDSLEVGDLDAVLSAHGPAYDLILAADVLVYMGDLGATSRGAAARLAPGGLFCFTVEAKEGDGFEQGPWRRWLHSETYVRETAHAAGLTVAQLSRTPLRQNFGQPVPGLVVALQKAASLAVRP